MALQDRAGPHFEVMAAVMVAAIALGGSGCGRRVVGVAKPEALLAWEPHSADPSARITTVSSTADRVYVGFSDGELFFRANAVGAVTPPCPATR